MVDVFSSNLLTTYLAISIASAPPHPSVSSTATSCDTSPMWVNYVSGRLHGTCTTIATHNINHIGCAVECFNNQYCTSVDIMCDDGCICRICKGTPMVLPPLTGDQYSLRGVVLTTGENLTSMVSYPIENYAVDSLLLIGCTLASSQTILQLVNKDDTIVAIRITIRVEDQVASGNQYVDGWGVENDRGLGVGFAAGETVDLVIRSYDTFFMFKMKHRSAAWVFQDARARDVRYLNISTIGTGGYLHYVHMMP